MSDEASQSTRQDKVLSWLGQQGLTVEDFTELTGDVSLRRYVRVAHDGETAIVGIYPPEIRPACPQLPRHHTAALEGGSQGTPDPCQRLRAGFHASGGRGLRHRL